MASPLPPATLSGVISNQQAFLSWPRAAGATSYNVKRSTVSGGPYVTVGNISGSSRRLTPPFTQEDYADSDIVAGVTYYYVVTSVEGVVESGISPQVSVTPGTIPVAPTSLSATPGDHQVSLSWAAPAGAVSYKVWRATTHGGAYTLLVAQAGTTYPDTGLTNGTTYYYVVSAIGSSGESPLTDEVSGTPTGGGSTMTTATRTSGVAPLGVSFDAVDETTPFAWTSGVAQPSGADFAKFAYLWDFGDGTSGTWPSDGRSKNRAIGYTAGHVYETPGTYTVTLTVIKDDNTILVYTQVITVTAFAGTTYYISATGNDSNDGLTTGTPWQTIAKVKANIATNRQFLFKKGDTFVTSLNNILINANGPGIFGSYGSGALPTLQSTDTSSGFSLFNVVANDWRWMDLNLIGPAATDQVGAIFLDPSAKRSNITILRVSTSFWRVPFSSTEVPATYNSPSTENMIIAGCTVDQPYVNGIFIGGYHNAVIGNSVSNCSTSHLVRIWLAHKFAASNNFFTGAGATRHDLKVHAPSGHASHPNSQYVYISFNSHRNSQVWPMSIGPEDNAADEFVHDVVVDSCDLISPVGQVVQTFIHMIVVNFTCRNCWTNATNNKYFSIVLCDVSTNGAVPVPDNVKIYGNSLYKSDSQVGNDIAIVSISSSAVGSVIVRDCILDAPNVPSATINSGTCPGFSQDHNFIGDPLFVNAAANNFHLTPGSPCVNAGVQDARLRKDYDVVDRPLSTAPNIGAYQLP